MLQCGEFDDGVGKVGEMVTAQVEVPQLLQVPQL